MDNLVANHGVRRTLHAADLEAAHKAGQPAIVADVEDFDFLGGKNSRAAGGSASARQGMGDAKPIAFAKRQMRPKGRPG